MRSEQSSRKITERKNRKTLLPSQSENEASPQQAAGYQTEGHCRGDTTVSPPSSLCKLTSQQAPRNLLIEDKGIHDYIMLLSICETCRYKGVNFLDFLRSGEKDIDDFIGRITV